MALERDVLVTKLAEYVRCLEEGAATTTRAEDRPRYRDRLAQAVRIFAAVSGATPAWEKVREVVAEEERAIGWSFLPGSKGADAETAFEGIRRYIRGHE